MKLLFVGLLSLVLSEDPLRAILKSHKATLNLYSQSKTKNGLKYTSKENQRRFRLFLRSARHIADYNEDEEDTGHYGVNFFSFKTEEEKKMFFGLNTTELYRDQEDTIKDDEQRLTTRSEVSLPYILLWPDTKHVTEVRQQGECGSCWAFSAVAAIETRYKKASDVLRSFSEQELLDCTYEKPYNWIDGCNGGLMPTAFKWSITNGGRLAANKDRGYEERDGPCRASSTPNAMKAYKLTAYGKVPKTEEAHLQALQDGAVSSGLEATEKFTQYDGSIMKDNTCVRRANHAITIVGYAPYYILIKNSWGEDWGEKGFARLARNHHNCKIYLDSSYPILTKTGNKDSGSDKATSYRSHRNETPPLCEKNCRKDCPIGNVACRDGTCKPQHMCQN